MKSGGRTHATICDGVYFHFIDAYLSFHKYHTGWRCRCALALFDAVANWLH